MTAKPLAAVAVATFALIACAQVPERAGGNPCNNGVCKLEVTVADAGCANPANISVTPDPLPVPLGSANRIEWTIRTGGYTWVPAPNGVSGLANPPFSNPHDTGSGKKYDIHDANPETRPTDHKYSIRLNDAQGRACAVKDPVIRNGA
jgi:hypothetical protein